MLDAFLFSDFLMLPMKVHITQGDYEGNAVIVSWTTPDEPGSNTVLYWAENSKTKSHAEGIVITYKYFNYTSGFIHHCTIKNLKVCVYYHLTALVCYQRINLISWFVVFCKNLDLICSLTQNITMRLELGILHDNSGS